MNQDSDFLRIRIGGECVARLQFEGKLDSAAIDRLIKYLELLGGFLKEDEIESLPGAVISMENFKYPGSTEK